MIIVAIVALSGVVLALIAALFVGLPSFPPEVASFMTTFLTYLRAGCGFVWNFCYPTPVKAMLAFSVAIIGVFQAYKLVMWVVRKIPMFGVSD